MLIISNTSPLLYLHQTSHLDLLRKLYGQVHVPTAVAAELAVGADLGIAVPTTTQYPWLSLLQVQHPEILPLVTDLGAGETEAIACALEHPGSLLILDDQLGRRIAHANGLRITGTLGVIPKARQEGLIGSVAPVIEQLRAAGLWISDALAADVVATAGDNDR